MTASLSVITREAKPAPSTTFAQDADALLACARWLQMASHYSAPADVTARRRARLRELIALARQMEGKLP